MPITRHTSSHQKSMRIAFCGVMAGLSLVIMLLGGLMQIATFAAPLAAAILLLPIRIEFDTRWAWATWLTTVGLSLLLGLDKEAGFFYLFVGYWPIVKWFVDFRLKKSLVRLLFKTVFFTAAIVAMYSLLIFAVGMPELSEELEQVGMWLDVAFVAVAVICMLMYDFLLKPVSFLYAQRLRPRLTFLKRL